jgi:3-hydroxybutyrate dehydrogenase
MSKVVFITGAAQGIGYEIARQFAGQGDTVIISDSDMDMLEAAEAELQHRYATVSSLSLDVTNEDQVQHSLDYILKTHGRIDVLINNAGLQYISLIDNFPTEKFEWLIRVMLVAPFVMIKHVFPVMKKQMWGRIINMSSINGLVGFSGKAAYNSAKHGVIGLTKVAALEGAAFNITVNALCPGYVDTELVRTQLNTLSETNNIPVSKVMEELIFPMIPQKRLLTVDEIAHYTLFLSDDKAKGITGQAIVIDGGYTAQ